MSAERFIGGSVLLVLVAVPLALGARRARGALMPEARGALAVVVDAVLSIAALLAVAHLLGAVGLLYSGPLVLICAGAGLAAWRFLPPPPAGPELRGAWTRANPASAFAAIPIVLAVGSWTARSFSTLERGTPGNIDTYWYHMPMAARFAGEHGIGGLFRTVDPTVGFYAADGSLLHGTGILLLGGDSLSPLVNLGFLALALVAAAAIGRLSGAGLIAPAAVAVVMLAPVMRGSQPGEAKDDVAVLALILAAAAVVASARGGFGAMAVAGVAIGMVAGVKVTGLAAAAALAVGAVALAPRGTRARGGLIMALAAAATGATWYLRNLIETGSPLPFVRLPGWDPPASPTLDGQLSTSIAHYATDFGVWADHFGPGLQAMFGRLWWAMLLAAVAGVVAGAIRGGAARVLAVSAGVAFLAYVTAPTMAAGPEGAPGLFPFQLRHGLAALLLGLLAGAWTVGRAPRRVRTGAGLALAILGLVALGADDSGPAIPSAVLAATAVAVAIAASIAVLPAGRRRALAIVAMVAGLALVGARYRDGAYLRGDFADAPVTRLGPRSQELAPLFEWARATSDRRFGIVGTFLQYPFYGLTLSNTVEQVGRPLDRGGFDERIGSCRTLIDLVRVRGYDYLVATPRRIEVGDPPAPPPERRCLDAAPGARRVLGGGRSVVAVYEIYPPAGKPSASIAASTSRSRPPCSSSSTTSLASSRAPTVPTTGRSRSAESSSSASCIIAVTAR